MGLDGLSVGTSAADVREGCPFRRQFGHRSFGQALAIHLLESTTAFDQVKGCLVLVVGLEAAEIEFLRDAFPGGR